MPIVLSKMQRINPNKKDEPKKWYAVQHALKQLDENQVANRIADETTLNPAEALMAIRQLRKVVQQALLDGMSVKLGDWGSFYAAVSSNGFASEKELTAQAIRNVKINFKPGNELKASMQKAEFVWVKNLMGDNTPASSGTTTPDSGGDENGGATGGNPL
jgi:predicted histone-like DNA-binding protein